MNENLKELRKANGNSEAEIGELLEISADEYIKKENGLINLTNGEKGVLSEYYGIDKKSLN
ncbi:hypothetical protein SH2C18_33680 [Clostridium sediminicola]|uniref:hypothetical protein n=1 Tax=Clostridium sediminicola TaxID=3114879 RepID=UPI0031F2409B